MVPHSLSASSSFPSFVAAPLAQSLPLYLLRRPPTTLPLPSEQGGGGGSSNIGAFSRPGIAGGDILLGEGGTHDTEEGNVAVVAIAEARLSTPGSVVAASGGTLPLHSEQGSGGSSSGAFGGGSSSGAADDDTRQLAEQFAAEDAAGGSGASSGGGGSGGGGGGGGRGGP